MFIEEEAKIVEKRRFRRTKFNDSVNYHFRDSNDFGGCLACDISEGGMKVNFNDFVPVNAEVLLQVKLRNIPKFVDITGRIIWSRKLAFSERYQIGLQFVKSDVMSQEEIRSYIRSHQSQ